MNPIRYRSGFTLVELLVSVVIAGILLTAIYQVLETNQRISLVQSEQILAQQTVRAGVDLLAQELREVSAGGGDLLRAEAGRVEFRALRSFGIACVVNPPQLRVVVQGQPFTMGRPDVYLFVEGDPESSADDRWVEARLNELPQNETCPGSRPARRLVLGGVAGDDWADVRPGAVVRSFVTVAYHLASDETGWYLARTMDDETVFLVGPVVPEAGVRFEYLDDRGNVTGVLPDIRQVRVSLLTDSRVRDRSGRGVEGALATTVFLRN